MSCLICGKPTEKSFIDTPNGTIIQDKIRCKECYRKQERWFKLWFGLLLVGTGFYLYMIVRGIIWTFKLFI